MTSCRLIFPFYLILNAIAACHSGDETLLRSDSNLQQKPSLLAEATNLLQKSADKRIVAHVTYLIDIKMNSGLAPCPGGEISLAIAEDFTFQMPNSKIQCLSATIDITSLVGSALSSGTGNFDPAQLKSDGVIFSIADVAGAKFDPPRPLLIGPIVQDTSPLVRLDRKIDSTVTVENPGAGESHQAKGSFSVKVLDFAGTYSNQYIKNPFTNVLHWSLTTEGFEGVSPVHGMLIRKLEFFWNLRPIMVPKIIVSVDNLGAFVSGGSQQDISALVGAVTISLTVKDFDLGGS